jgi:hypothetical protein
MRNGLQLALGVAFTCVVAGCSLLVSFDDIPDSGSDLNVDGTDSGLNSSSGESSSSSSSGSTSSSSSSSSSSTSSSSGGTDGGTTTTFPPACDTAINLAAIDCQGNTQAVCGGDVSATVAISGNDLVTCNAAGAATCVQHCSMGCANMPAADNLPSQCADCTAGNVDRWYCGKNTKWVSDDSDIAYHCDATGKYVAGSTAQCGKTFCHTNCTRTTDPLTGSCCQSTPDN